ncbi:hypothetical protein ACHWQZ_G004477 [Mnemiopsis leidyi]
MTKFIEILMSDKCFTITTFSSMICYGMFWTIPGSLIYEIKTNINEGMHVFGYLMTVLRVGKMLGHVIAAKVCGSVKPTNYPDIHLLSMTVQGLGVILMPFCTSWILLAVCWVFIGITLGVIETNNVFFNCAVNHENAPKYTNFYYFAFSFGAALTPPIVDGTKRMIDNPKTELIAMCSIVGALNFFMNLFTAAILKLRRYNGNVLGETVEFEEDKPTSFRAPIASNICLSLTAFIFMCGRNTMELFLLPFALHARANLSERTSYSLVQTVFFSTMVTRLVGVFAGPWLTKRVNNYLLLSLNTVLVVGVICMGVFEDKSYSGMVLTLVIFGLAFGSYQNTLLNWMNDRMALNPKNTAAFFFGTCFGSSLSPTIVPYLIKNSDGSIEVGNFQLIMEVTFAATATFCGLLMLTELLAEKSERGCAVEAINLVPVVTSQPQVERTQSALTFRDTPAPLSRNSFFEIQSKSALSVVTRRQNASRAGSSTGCFTPVI